MTEITHYSQVWSYRTPRGRLLLWGGWLALVALFVWCWQIMTRDTIWFFVADAPRQAADIGSRMVPPRWSYMGELWGPLWDTINIATLGTIGGVIMAVPVAFLAARNTTPSALILRPIALFIIVASRSINSLIWALLLVAIIGPGLLAGIVAIALRSIGFIGKLLYEAIEETDASQIEAIEATGASGPQVLNYGIVPQIMPTFWGITVFSLGYQHPRKHDPRSGRRGRHRPQAAGLAQHAGLEPGVGDPPADPCDCCAQRMGLGARAARHHLKPHCSQKVRFASPPAIRFGAGNDRRTRAASIWRSPSKGTGAFRGNCRKNSASVTDLSCRFVKPSETKETGDPRYDIP